MIHLKTIKAFDNYSDCDSNQFLSHRIDGAALIFSQTLILRRRHLYYLKNKTMPLKRIKYLNTLSFERYPSIDII